MSDRRAASRALARSLFALLAFATAAPAVLLACSSDDSNQLGGQPGGPSDDGGGSDSTLPSTSDDSAAPDTSDTRDTAPPPLNSVDAADIPDGGARVSPGVVTCGEGTCNTFAGNQCCSGGEEDGSACVATAIKCGAGASSFECNESADCVVGTVCCGTVAVDDAGDEAGAFFVLTTRCLAKCAPPLPQFCRTNGECGPDDGGCVVQTCSDGMTYEICGVFGTAEDSGIAFSCNPQ